ALATSCICQPSAPMKNLHDLSTQILMDMDVEANPGPTVSVQTYSLEGFEQELEECLTARLEQRFEQMETRMQRRIDQLEAGLRKQNDAVSGIVGMCEKEHYQSLQREDYLLSDMRALSANLNSFAAEIENKIRIVEDETDKKEGSSKKNSIKLLGVCEQEHEP
ncbi:MAG: hypothetical protein DSZ28_03310, partial [Thiothrix sp.]